MLKALIAIATQTEATANWNPLSEGRVIESFGLATTSTVEVGSYGTIDKIFPMDRY